MGTAIVSDPSASHSSRINIMKHRAVASAPDELIPLASDNATNESPVSGPADKKWQIDRASGVPAPVIRANMISMRLSRKGQIKVAFFEQG
jgi:hypothetical protein